MKTVQETVYEERPMDIYHVKYGEVIDTFKVPAIEYKEVTAYHCCCVTVYQLPPPCPSPAVGTCAPAADCAKGNCGPAGCPELVPCKVLRKCPYTTTQEVAVEKEVKRPRLTCELVKETIITCIPHVVCKEVPVQVCCPMPCCRHCHSATAATSGCTSCGK
jgi:hypothetical protein